MWAGRRCGCRNIKYKLFYGSWNGENISTLLDKNSEHFWISSTSYLIPPPYSHIPVYIPVVWCGLPVALYGTTPTRPPPPAISPLRPMTNQECGVITEFHHQPKQNNHPPLENKQVCDYVFQTFYYSIVVRFLLQKEYKWVLHRSLTTIDNTGPSTTMGSQDSHKVF